MVEVKDNPDESQFEVYVDGTRAGVMAYSIDGDTVTIPHTEIDPAYGGQGLGETLVRTALDQIRDTGLLIRPHCPYVKAFLVKHPEYQDLVKAA